MNSLTVVKIFQTWEARNQVQCYLQYMRRVPFSVKL